MNTPLAKQDFASAATLNFLATDYTDYADFESWCAFLLLSRPILIIGCFRVCGNASRFRFE